MAPIGRSFESWALVVLAGLAALPSRAPQRRIPLAVALDSQIKVGDARRPIASLQKVGEAARALRSFGARSLEAHETVGDRAVTLLFDWPEDANAPIKVWSVVRKSPSPAGAGDLGLDDGIALSWTPMAQGLILGTSVVLPQPDLPHLSLRVMNGELSAEWSGRSPFAARFELDDVPHVAWFSDADFDGRIGGDADRWIAGPQEIVEKLNFANPQVEMRRLDEGWCWNAGSLWFATSNDGAAALEVRPPVSSSTLCAQHADRVEREFIADLKTPRELFLKANKFGDPDRPVTAQPVSWFYALDLKSAHERAAREAKPLILELTSMSCGWCRFLSWATHTDREVDELLDHFARVKIILDLDVDQTARTLGVEGVPCTIVFDADGEVFDRLPGFSGPPTYAAKLRQWLEALE